MNGGWLIKRLRGRTLLPAALSTAALWPAALWAQAGFDSSVFDAPASSKGSLDLNSWPIETLLLVVIVVLAATVCFTAIYRNLLETQRWWPLNAYGFCVFLITSTAFLAAMLLFWEDLVIPAQGPEEVFNRYGLKIGLVVLWLVIAAIVLSVIRSPQAKPAKA